MSQRKGRFTAARPISLAEGWSFERLTTPSRLFGANGLRTGPDGRVYVAQVAGSQISALDVATGGGEIETISAPGSDIVAPDDMAFDAQGNMFVTEYYDGRVSVRSKRGDTRVLRDDLPGANGITFHKGRLFIDECRIGGRLMELDLNGGAPRVLLENMMMPNAMEVGPDGKLYYPVLATNEIWRIDPDGGTPERVAADLAGPDAVKIDAKGFIVSTQVGSGQVLRIDPQSGDRTVLAQLNPGLDNLTFVGDRLFVSNFTGEITEVLGDGKTRNVLPRAFSWPLDLAVGSDGKVYVCDGHHFFSVGKGGELEVVAMLFSPGYPGNVRGIATSGDGEFIITTSLGQVTRYRPASGESEVLAEGYNQLYGVAVAPAGSGSQGSIAVAELGTGRVLSVRAGQVDVLASGLNAPVGVAFAADGTCFVAESGAGRVVKIVGSGVETVVDGLQQPQGITVHDGVLYIVDAEQKTLTAFDLKNKTRSEVASGLPVGAPAGVKLKPLLGLMPFTGPQGPFAGISAGPDGTLYISADGEGSVIALRKRGA